MTIEPTEPMINVSGGKPAPPTHELATFLKQDLAEMRSEYERIRSRTAEDPGTAGDEGEEVWAELLRKWIPGSYQIRTKGRILGAGGAAGPQVDVIVLRPSYPERLLEKKLYLAGGVAAVFECKNTLRAGHIAGASRRAAEVNALASARRSTPFSEMVPDILFGLLAHSHSWTTTTSDPRGNIDAALSKAIANVQSFSDPLSLVCVADLATWTMMRCPYDGPGLLSPELWQMVQQSRGLPDEGAAWVAYMRYVTGLGETDAPPPNPIAAMIAFLLGRLAYDDPPIRPLSQYFLAANMAGSGQSVVSKLFTLNTFSDEVRRGFPHRLTNGVEGLDWAVFFPH